MKNQSIFHCIRARQLLCIIFYHQTTIVPFLSATKESLHENFSRELPWVTYGDTIKPEQAIFITKVGMTSGWQLYRFGGRSTGRSYIRTDQISQNWSGDLVLHLLAHRSQHLQVQSLPTAPDIFQELESNQHSFGFKHVDVLNPLVCILQSRIPVNKYGNLVRVVKIGNLNASIPWISAEL